MHTFLFDLCEMRCMGINMITKTKQGNIQGVSDGSIIVFRGIPYAEPPVGSLRFCPPKPVKAWNGTLLAQNFGDKAFQPKNKADNTGYSEDCLTLNIWTPGIDDMKRKVVFWIHGGGFVSGSGSNPETSGRAFAEKDDIVYVSINYRLGAFGFLHLGDLLGESYAASCNCGLLDIIAALRWVNENISSFGGDPDSITLMGQSAGAKCIGALLVTPEAKGLFHRAILESGSIQAIRDRDTAQDITLSLIKELGLKHDEVHKLVELPAEEILKAELRLTASVRGVYIFGPVVDGLTIPQPPERMIEEGIVNNVPLLIGTNKDEAKSFDFVKPNQTNSKEYILNTLFGKNGPAVIEAYNKVCMVKAEDDAWYEILTDYLYRMASTRLAARLADRGNPVWMYRFDFQGSSGAVHGAETAFIWNDCITRIIPPSGESLAKKMHNAWISFIRTGNPQIEELPFWKPYTSSECKTMLFDTNCSVQALNGLHENLDFPMQMIIL